jgi:hypothetical protein
LQSDYEFGHINGTAHPTGNVIVICSAKHAPYALTHFSNYYCISLFLRITLISHPPNPPSPEQPLDAARAKDEIRDVILVRNLTREDDSQGLFAISFDTLENPDFW